MGGRSTARRDILRDAHEGHETVHPKRYVERVGPRKRMATSELGYDYTETMMNWHPSRMQILGLLLILVGFLAILALALWFSAHRL